MDSKQAQNNLTDEHITQYYSRVRTDSETLCQPLEIEDYGIQTMPEVSPPKWHLAHTSWFFETMLLKAFQKNYKEYHPTFSILFNSYYDTIGTYHPRAKRGILSRPTVKEVFLYRTYIDNAMAELLDNTTHAEYEKILSLTILGLNHEQQHQELLLTDIKHIFASNPMLPLYQSPDSKLKTRQPVEKTQTQWLKLKGGIKLIGRDRDKNFAYDNEGPQHKVYLEDFYLASRPVTNADYIEFIEAGGYSEVSYWLSDAWQTIKKEKWQAPLYWELKNGNWYEKTLSGFHIVDSNSPVCHVSYFEAAAYVRWKNESEPGVRLPTEAEWEIAANAVTIDGNLRHTLKFQPQSSISSEDNPHLQQMYGDVWEWTQSPYTAYPGYHAENGALGEYNGKFMSSQMILRGGSCVTPLDHIRSTYRNFFYPHERWQFSGFRLARDI